MRRQDDDPLVLSTGVGTRLLAFASPALLFVLVALGLSRTGGLSWLGGVLLVLGLVMMVSALFDQPMRIVIGPKGIERRALLRSKFFEWSEVSALTRLPKRGVGKAVGRLVGGGPAPEGVLTTGLMARIGTKRVLLLDRSERLDEWEVLTSSVRRWSPGCGLPGKPTGSL